MRCWQKNLLLAGATVVFQEVVMRVDARRREVEFAEWLRQMRRVYFPDPVEDEKR